MANVVNILKIVRQINTDAGVVAKNMKKAKVVAAKTGQLHRPKAVKPKKGLTLDQLILATPNRVASYSKRDRVTLVSLKVSKDKNRIVSKTLTYDITKSGPPQVRPHKHWFEKREDVPFYKAKKVKFNCDCEFYKFHCEYANNHHDAADIRFCNGEYPIITNPRLQPRMCKHGFILLKYLKKNRM